MRKKAPTPVLDSTNDGLDLATELQGHAIKNQDLLIASGAISLKGSEGTSAADDDVAAAVCYPPRVHLAFINIANRGILNLSHYPSLNPRHNYSIRVPTTKTRLIPVSIPSTSWQIQSPTLETYSRTSPP